MLTRFTDDRLQVELTTKGCEIPEDERERLQPWITQIAESARDFPGASLRIKAIHHPRGGMYNVEGELRLPGRTLFTGDQDAYLDTALHRCTRKLARKVEQYRERPDREAIAAAERREALDRDVIASQDPEAGRLGEAVRAGDYRAFRTALAAYEEWLRKRVGRVVQRIPEAQARVGGQLRLGDVVEEVYLDAFERFAGRSTAVRLSEWLDGLIEPAIRSLLRHPDEGREAASLARTVREGPLG